MNHHRQAIRNLLLRLGMHVAPERVVDELEKVGVEVSCNFVLKVKSQMLRDEAAAERERAKRTPVNKSRKRPQQQKIPRRPR